MRPPVFFRIDSLAQSAFAVGIGIPTLDEVADGNPDKGNHNIGDPKRPHAAVVEQEKWWAKKEERPESGNAGADRFLFRTGCRRSGKPAGKGQRGSATSG